MKGLQLVNLLLLKSTDAAQIQLCRLIGNMDALESTKVDVEVDHDSSGVGDKPP